MDVLARVMKEAMTTVAAGLLLGVTATLARRGRELYPGAACCNH
jgi:hypothetical protein